MTRKEKLYSLSKIICQKLESKILSNDYLVLFQSQILETQTTVVTSPNNIEKLSRTKYFRFDDVNHSISFQEDQNTFIEFIPEDGCENEITSVKKLKEALIEDFIFIKKKYATNFLGRKKGI